MKSGNIQVGGYNDSIFSPSSLIQNRTGDFGASFTHLRRSALQPFLQCTASLPGMHRGVLSSVAVSSRMRGGRREHQEEK